MNVLYLALNITITAAVVVGWCFVFRAWMLGYALKKAAPQDRVGPWGTAVAWERSDHPKIVDMRTRQQRSRVYSGVAFALAFAVVLGARLALNPDHSLTGHPQADVIPKEKIEDALSCLPAQVAVAYPLLASPILLIIALVRVALAQRYCLPQRRGLFPEAFQPASYDERGLSHLRGARLFGLLAAVCVVVPIVSYLAFRSCFAHG